MPTKRTVLIFTFYYFIGVIYSTDDVMRKGKFLGITGFLSGSANGFHLPPFWKQWNALLQVNVEKNRHHGVFVIPASSLYYPPYGGYGLYSPYNLGEIGGGGGVPIHPNLLRPTLFDEYKASTTTLTPFNADAMDKPKFDLITDNELNDQWDGESNDVHTAESDPNVSVFKLNVRDDRKTHKRDIEHKNQTDGEAVVATVVEITEPYTFGTTALAAATDATTASVSAFDSLVQTTTQIPEMQTATAAAPTTTTTPDTPTSSPLPPTSTPTITTIATTTTEISSSQSGFKPILNVYYGGTPNAQANLVYFTTPEPAENLEPPTEKTQMATDRNDFGKFRPSIQYEYRNYRYNTDNHFVPIVGAKQIF